MDIHKIRQLNSILDRCDNFVLHERTANEDFFNKGEGPLFDLFSGEIEVEEMDQEERRKSGQVLGSIRKYFLSSFLNHLRRIG